MANGLKLDCTRMSGPQGQDSTRKKRDHGVVNSSRNGRPGLQNDNCGCRGHSYQQSLRKVKSKGSGRDPNTGGGGAKKVDRERTLKQKWISNGCKKAERAWEKIDGVGRRAGEGFLKSPKKCAPSVTGLIPPKRGPTQALAKKKVRDGGLSWRPGRGREGGGGKGGHTYRLWKKRKTGTANLEGRVLEK